MTHKNGIKWAFAAFSLLKVISAAAAEIIDYVKSTEGAVGYQKCRKTPSLQVGDVAAYSAQPRF
jgi:hypothetical protein